MEIAIRYRPVDRSTWRSGMIQNISCTGVLFQADVPLEPATAVALQLPCTPQVCGDAKPLMTASGRVVRSVRGKRKWEVAVSFTEFRLVAIPDQIGYEPTPAAGVAGHRLVQLMTVILGSAEILSLNGDDPESEKWLQRIREAASEAASLVRNAEIAKRRLGS